MCTRAERAQRLRQDWGFQGYVVSDCAAKFAENGPSLSLVYLGDGAFATGPNTKLYVKNGRTQGAAIYVEGLFMNATWRVPAN